MCFYNVNNIKTVLNILLSFLPLVPAPEVTVAPDNTEVLPGTTASISFNCSIISFSTVNVTWTTTANDSIITQPSLESESEFGVYTSILTLDGVLPSNEGVYTCTAVNDIGRNNDTGTLTVISKRWKEREGEMRGGGRREGGERGGRGGGRKCGKYRTF